MDKNDTADSTEDESVNVDDLKEIESTEYSVVLIFSQMQPLYGKFFFVNSRIYFELGDKWVLDEYLID